MRTGSYTPGQQAHYLHDLRIQVVPFGPGFDDLPGKIHDLNPNADRAYSHRYRLASELLSGGNTTKSAQFANVMEGLNKRASVHDLRSVATKLFEKRQHTRSYLRGELAAMQKLTLSLVEPEHLTIEIQSWEDGKVEGFEGSFRQTVLEASSALGLFHSELLTALKRKGIEIHRRVLDGYCQKILFAFHRTGFLTPTSYLKENLKRILTTLKAILEASPEKIFPVPERARVIEPLHEVLSLSFLFLRDTDRKLF
jgi:hypothetical protein